MRRTTKPRAHLGAVCQACGNAVLVTPCTSRRCPRWVTVCDCPAVRRAFIATDGRCEHCRGVAQVTL